MKLFSLSACFTLLTNFQNLHLAVTASKREEFKENHSVFMRFCACYLHI